MIFVAMGAFAQTKRGPADTLLLLKLGYKPAPFFLQLHKTRKNVPVSTYFLPADFYATQLGFFCKQEIKFDKLTKIPFRFRLGSVEECDRLEGKGKRN